MAKSYILVILSVFLTVSNGAPLDESTQETTLTPTTQEPVSLTTLVTASSTGGSSDSSATTLNSTVSLDGTDVTPGNSSSTVLTINIDQPQTTQSSLQMLAEVTPGVSILQQIVKGEGKRGLYEIIAVVISRIKAGLESYISDSPIFMVAKPSDLEMSTTRDGLIALDSVAEGMKRIPGFVHKYVPYLENDTASSVFYSVTIPYKPEETVTASTEGYAEEGGEGGSGGGEDGGGEGEGEEGEGGEGEGGEGEGGEGEGGEGEGGEGEGGEGEGGEGEGGEGEGGEGEGGEGEGGEGEGGEGEGGEGEGGEGEGDEVDGDGEEGDGEEDDGVEGDGVEGDGVEGDGVEGDGVEGDGEDEGESTTSLPKTTTHFSKSTDNCPGSTTYLPEATAITTTTVFFTSKHSTSHHKTKRTTRKPTLSTGGGIFDDYEGENSDKIPDEIVANGLIQGTTGSSGV